MKQTIVIVYLLNINQYHVMTSHWWHNNPPSLILTFYVTEFWVKCNCRVLFSLTCLHTYPRTDFKSDCFHTEYPAQSSIEGSTQVAQTYLLGTFVYWIVDILIVGKKSWQNERILILIFLLRISKKYIASSYPWVCPNLSSTDGGRGRLETQKTLVPKSILGLGSFKVKYQSFTTA